MKQCRDTDPATLYRKCWKYVVDCTMANCWHLRREESEDITSQAFCELLNNDKTNLQNWVWMAKMRGRWHYQTQYLRYQPSGSLADMRDSRASQPDGCEVFHPVQLLKRKDAKAAFALMMQGWNRAEVAKQLNRHPVGVTKMMERLRNRCKKYLKKDIAIYKGLQTE